MVLIFGVWPRSLRRLHGVQEIVGANPTTPTILIIGVIFFRLLLCRSDLHTLTRQIDLNIGQELDKVAPCPIVRKDRDLIKGKLNNMTYVPPKNILKKYADLLVNFALGGGKGIKKGEVVYLVSYDSSKALIIEIRRAILRAGGHIISTSSPDTEVRRCSLNRDFYLLAKDYQLDFFPRKYMKGLVDEMDHFLLIMGQSNKRELEGIDPEKITRKIMAYKPYSEWRDEKENQGRFTWTIALFATESIAKEADLSLKEYWRQIIKACYLDKQNPIKEWKKIFRKIETIKDKLDRMKIKQVQIKGPDADLRVKIGEKRKWTGGGGRNIPSFEIFTSPDWRGTEGWIRFNQPLYSHGNLIKGIELRFEKGRVVKANAKKNKKLLWQIIKTPGADALGEFSLTDGRFSRIEKFMAETLYDENMGGPGGNMHLALGRSFKECFYGNSKNFKKKDWRKFGFNDSAIHEDLISTSPRIVTAFLKNGEEKTIYKNGKFVI